MQFKPESKIVQAAVLLLSAGVYTTIEQVPNMGNLREVVLQVLEG